MHSFGSNINGYGGKTHYTDSQNSDTTAPNGRAVPFAVLTPGGQSGNYWIHPRIAPSVLDFGIRWRWVGSFTPRPLYSEGKSLQYPTDRTLGGTQNRNIRAGNSNPCISQEATKMGSHPASGGYKYRGVVLRDGVGRGANNPTL
jgi:hypothetical protein